MTNEIDASVYLGATTLPQMPPAEPDAPAWERELDRLSQETTDLREAGKLTTERFRAVLAESQALIEQSGDPDAKELIGAIWAQRPDGYGAETRQA